MIRLFRKFFGFLAYFVIALVIILSSQRAGDLYESKNFVYSMFGEDSRSWLIFNLGIIIGGLMFTSWGLSLYKKIYMRSDSFRQVWFVLPGISFAFIGIIHRGLHRELHFFFVVLFWLTWSYMNTIVSRRMKRPEAIILRYMTYISFLSSLALFLIGREYFHWAELLFAFFGFFQILFLTDLLFSPSWLSFLKFRR